MPLIAAILAVVITAQPLVDEDVLEPSVQNEVDHALSLAPTNDVPVSAAALAFAALWETNGMSATARAIALVSSQRDGRWFHDGYDVTPVAVRILRRAAGYDRSVGRLFPDCEIRRREFAEATNCEMKVVGSRCRQEGGAGKTKPCKRNVHDEENRDL